MPKRKSQFSEELQQKYPFFRKGSNDFEAECSTCKYGTFVSVANKGRLSLDMHIDSSNLSDSEEYATNDDSPNDHAQNKAEQRYQEAIAA